MRVEQDRRVVMALLPLAWPNAEDDVREVAASMLLVLRILFLAFSSIVMHFEMLQ